MSLSSQGIEYDVIDIKKHSDEFTQKFDELKNVKESNKISIWYNKIYLDGSFYGTQWFLRKAFRQGRETVKEFLSKNFADYIKLLEMMIAAEGTIKYSDERYRELLEIMNNNKIFILLIKPGLTNTKEIYKNDETIEMSNVIDNIISNLDSYINKFDKVKILYDNRNMSFISQARSISGSGSDPGSPTINPFSCMPYGIAPRLLMMNRERSQSED
tara:strand:+ start:2975 stop:3619 length:645 start_codon:yes stop_codon:yes gene_type:complete